MSVLWPTDDVCKSYRGCELFQSWFLVEKELESLPGDEEGRIARNIFHMSPKDPTGRQVGLRPTHIASSIPHVAAKASF